MILIVVMIGVGLLALAAVLSLAYGTAVRVQDVRELGRRLRPLDLRAFANLTSASEEEFLRSHLNSSQFRSVQRLRLRASGAYVRSAAHNAGILIRIGTLAQNSPDPATVAAARVLVHDALRMRLLATAVQLRIALCILFPVLPFSPHMVGERYERLVVRAGCLGRDWTRTSAALAS
jgi:hypothetical protein